MKRPTKKPLLKTIILGMLACASIISSQRAIADLTITEGYLREVPPGQMMSAAFMQITNNTAEKIILTGGESSEVKAIEVHTHKHIDGVMMMTRLDGLEIHPGDSLTLKPGGLHLMFIGLKTPLQKGKRFSFQLNFADGNSQILELPIKSLVH